MEFIWEVCFREQEQGLDGGKLGRVQAAVVLPDTGPTADHRVPPSGNIQAGWEIS